MANPVLAFDPKERKLILSALGKSCGNSILTDAEANVLERLATAIEAAAPEPVIITSATGPPACSPRIIPAGRRSTNCREPA